MGRWSVKRIDVSCTTLSPGGSWRLASIPPLNHAKPGFDIAQRSKDSLGFFFFAVLVTDGRDDLNSHGTKHPD
jgi:hypothetical protein